MSNKKIAIKQKIGKAMLCLFGLGFLALFIVPIASEMGLAPFLKAIGVVSLILLYVYIALKLIHNDE